VRRPGKGLAGGLTSAAVRVLRVQLSVGLMNFNLKYFNFDQTISGAEKAHRFIQISVQKASFI